MTRDDETILIIKGAISDLPESEQSKVMACIKDMNELGTKHGDKAFAFAIALAGAVMQREAEKL